MNEEYVILFAFIVFVAFVFYNFTLKAFAFINDKNAEVVASIQESEKILQEAIILLKNTEMKQKNFDIVLENLTSNHENSLIEVKKDYAINLDLLIEDRKFELENELKTAKNNIIHNIKKDIVNLIENVILTESKLNS